MNRRLAVISIILVCLIIVTHVVAISAQTVDINILFLNVEPGDIDDVSPVKYKEGIEESGFIPQLYPDVCLRAVVPSSEKYSIKVPAGMPDISTYLAVKSPTCYTMEEDRKYKIPTNGPSILAQKDQILQGWIKEFKAKIAADSSLDVFKKGFKWDQATFEEYENLGTTWTVGDVDPATGQGKDTVYGGREDPKEFMFPIPTDPLPVITIRATTHFKWKIKVPIDVNEPGMSGLGNLYLGNQDDQMNDIIRVIILDMTPPVAVGFTPNVLFGTSGDRIRDFNTRKAARNVTLIPDNPAELTVLVADNAQYSWVADIGVYHDRAKLSCLVYAETYVAGFSKDDPSGRDPSRIEKQTGEFYVGVGEPPEGVGEFVWVGPINLAEYYAGGSAQKDLPTATVPETTFDAAQGAGQNVDLLNIHLWKVPLPSLENALHARLLAQVPKIKDRRATFLSHQFASACFFQYLSNELGAAHTIDNLIYDGPGGSGISLGGFDILRFTVAVSDAAGNWSVPDFLSPQPAMDPLAHLTKYSYKASVTGDIKPYFDENRPKIQHNYQMPLVVFDNDKPNPMLLVTAKGADGSTRTTRYYIPNGDLADLEPSSPVPQINPWVNDYQVWEFDADGESDAMKFLKDHDRERYEEYKKSLQIQENSRVVYEVVGYDNVNKWVVREDPFSYFGVTTPIAYSDGAKDDSMIRPVTWKIIDPTTEADPQLASLLYEDPAAKTYVYPDYVYRNVEDSKDYGVEFTVHDRSNFNDPAQNGGLTFNWRTLRLKFKILKNNATWEGIEKLGSKEQVEHDSNKDK